jgi:hypothetical protein
MPAPRFQPGFRISVIDVAVLVIAAVAAAVTWSVLPALAAVIAFVVLHFFLFCNIARVSRPLELAWAAVFVLLGLSTTLTEWPGWPMTFGLTLVATVIVVAIELRRPSYHGIAWQRVNPALPEWWAAQQGNAESSGAGDGPAR